jgi:adenosine deaminase
MLRNASERALAWYREHDNIRPFLTPRRWSVEEVLPLFETRTFDEFIATFSFTGYFIRDASDFRLLVAGVLESLRAQNVVYAEITVSVREYVRQGVPLPDLLASLDEAASRPDIRVQWIVDIVRDFGVEAGLELLNQIVEIRPKSVVGMTIGGSEHLFPPAQFAPVYDLARKHGLRLTIHAGEALGPQSVWDALKLGIERIGHGVRAIEDPALVKHLADNHIPLEVCPTSNLRTGIYPSYQAHPVKALYEAGVPITINSDDPTFFHTTLVDEYAHVHNMGVAEGDILEMLRNGFRYAFLPETEKARYLGLIADN